MKAANHRRATLAVCIVSFIVLFTWALEEGVAQCGGGGGGVVTCLGQDPSNSFTNDGSGGGGGAVDPTCSPIIVSLSDLAPQMTGVSGGVIFDISGTGHPIQISWTAAESAAGFLVLDRNGDGLINNGTELFGNFTQQPPSQHPNGFLALAEFDKPENGGNADGVIDRRDAVFSNLRIWIDANHNGVSEPNELQTMDQAGITAIDLTYLSDYRKDQYGNLFRYRGRIYHQDGKPRWAYDVFLMH